MSLGLTRTEKQTNLLARWEYYRVAQSSGQNFDELFLGNQLTGSNEIRHGYSATAHILFVQILAHLLYSLACRMLKGCGFVFVCFFLSFFVCVCVSSAYLCECITD